MLTEGKLIISSLLTLLLFLYCFISTWNAMYIVLLLLLLVGWVGGGGCFILGCGWGDRDRVSSYRFFFL